MVKTVVRLGSWSGKVTGGSGRVRAETVRGPSSVGSSGRSCHESSIDGWAKLGASRGDTVALVGPPNFLGGAPLANLAMSKVVGIFPNPA